MDTNKKTFNFTILFVVMYAILAIVILIWIWFPKNSKSINASMSYEKVDGRQKALDIYTNTITKLLSMSDLSLLYEKLDYDYIKKYNLNENNYKDYLETAGYISKNGIKMADSTVSIQDKTYIYRYKYYCNGKTCYVNVIETSPYEYTLSFEQESIPIVSNSSNENNEENIVSSNTKISIIDNIKYEVSRTTIRENGITYTLKITNNSDKNVEYNFDNITNVLAILNDGKIANLGGAVISSDDDSLTPNGSLEKELFFPVSSADQSKITSIRLKNVKIGDEKKTVNINV